MLDLGKHVRQNVLRGGLEWGEQFLFAGLLQQPEGEDTDGNSGSWLGVATSERLIVESVPMDDEGALPVDEEGVLQIYRYEFRYRDVERVRAGRVKGAPVPGRWIRLYPRRRSHPFPGARAKDGSCRFDLLENFDNSDHAKMVAEYPGWLVARFDEGHGEAATEDEPAPPVPARRPRRRRRRAPVADPEPAAEDEIAIGGAQAIYDQGCFELTKREDREFARAQIGIVGAIAFASVMLMLGVELLFMIVVVIAGVLSVLKGITGGARDAVRRVAHVPRESLSIERGKKSAPSRVTVDGHRLDGLGAPVRVVVGVTPGVRLQHSEVPAHYRAWAVFERGVILLGEGARDECTYLSKMVRKALRQRQVDYVEGVVHRPMNSAAAFVLLVPHALIVVMAAVAAVSHNEPLAYLGAAGLIAMEFLKPGLAEQLSAPALRKQLGRELRTEIPKR